ncbi:MAG: S8 family serine peptidase [Thermoanaerobaculia bacterium]
MSPGPVRGFFCDSDHSLTGRFQNEKMVRAFHDSGGNDGVRDACNSSPARVAEAITVNSSTNSDARSSFSNWGTCTDIFAPGTNITSAWYTSNTATNTISGTSMASPHVAGVAALYLASNTSASPTAVWTAIRDNSTPNKITSAGSGSPNRLVYSIWGTSAPTNPPSISSFSPTSGAAGTSVTINGSNFSGASAVKFNGTSASFSVVSSTQISTSVPSGATTGPISVTTSAGTATSSGTFTVTAGGGTTSQLLANPGFESGNVSWTTTSGVITNSTSRTPQAGSWYAWLCGYARV